MPGPVHVCFFQKEGSVRVCVCELLIVYLCYLDIHVFRCMFFYHPICNLVILCANLEHVLFQSSLKRS